MWRNNNDPLSVAGSVGFYNEVQSHQFDRSDFDSVRSAQCGCPDRPWLMWCLLIKQCTLPATSETSYTLNNLKRKYNQTMRICLWAPGLHRCSQKKQGQGSGVRWSKVQEVLLLLLSVKAFCVSTFLGLEHICKTCKQIYFKEDGKRVSMWFNIQSEQNKSNKLFCPVIIFD